MEVHPDELMTIQLTPKGVELFKDMQEYNIHFFDLPVMAKKINMHPKYLKKKIEKLKKQDIIKVIDKKGSFYLIQLPINQGKSFLISQLKEE